MRESLRAAVADLEPAPPPFTEALAHRALLFPVLGEFEPGLLRGIALAAQTVYGESEAFYAPINLFSSADPNVWRLVIGSGEYARVVDDTIPHLMWSINGHWATWYLDDAIGMVGASSEAFVDALFAAAGVSEEAMLEEFLAELRNDAEAGLHPLLKRPLLVHLFGEKRADELLEPWRDGQ